MHTTSDVWLTPRPTYPSVFIRTVWARRAVRKGVRLSGLRFSARLSIMPLDLLSNIRRNLGIVTMGVGCLLAQTTERPVFTDVFFPEGKSNPE